jgi:hypothetical protein
MNTISFPMKTLLVGLLSALVCTGVLIGNSKLERRAREQASQDYQIAQAKAACAQKEPYYSKRLASYALASSALADVIVNAPVAKVRIALATLMTQEDWTLIDQSQTEPAFELIAKEPVGKGLLARCERKPWGALRVISRYELQPLDAAITQVKVSVEVWHEDREMVSL